MATAPDRGRALTSGTETECASPRCGDASCASWQRECMTDLDDQKRPMFGNYQLKPNSGVNPPYSPAYPVEWGCMLRTLEIITRVDPSKVANLLADAPFEMVNDRVAFRFMLSPEHSLAVH